MECLGNEGSVTATVRNAGAIFGCNMSGAATPVFINCYATGPVKGDFESGQITGYAGNGQAYNCYGSGTIEGYYRPDMSDAMLRGNPQATNCYSTTPDARAITVTPEQVQNGELCYLLNQYGDPYAPVWYQTLGVDDHPVLDATHAKVLLADDGTYYNEDDPNGIGELDNWIIGQSNNCEIVKSSNRQIYDLSGRKWSSRKLPSGVYIFGGKKVAIK